MSTPIKGIKIGNEVHKIDYESLENKPIKPRIISVILSKDAWADNQQSAVVSGVVSDPLSQIITISPDTSCLTEYLDVGVQCIGQSSDTLTFSCEEVPSSDFTIYVAIQEI